MRASNPPSNSAEVSGLRFELPMALALNPATFALKTFTVVAEYV